MKNTLLWLGLCAGHAFANIDFIRVQPTCDYNAIGFSGCLRGQHCTPKNTCEASVDKRSLYPESFRRRVVDHSKRQNPVFSTDGSCGPNHGNTLCDPNSTVYTGTCCSSYGWCGNTPAHCGEGCVSGCTAAQSSAVGSPAPSGTFRADGRCGKDFGGAACDPNGAFGGCCSSYGYCGNTDGHCLVANGCQSGCTDSTTTKPPGTTTRPTPSNSATVSSSTGEPVLNTPTTSAGAAATGKATTDGSCGVNFGGTVCGNWPQGACCSMYGYCGNTTSHCGEGCQSGPCLNGAVTPAPGPSPAPANPNPGSFKIVGQSGVPAMHMGLLPNGRVVFLDKIENYTQVKLPNGQYAYSTEYNPKTNTYVPLSYKTNSFCAGGVFLADGTFVALGGNGVLDWIDPTVGDGFDGIRYLKRSFNNAALNGQPWSEPGNKLASKRWYPSVQILPDGRVFVASGSLNGLDPSVAANNNPTYEILDSTGKSNGINVDMQILVKNQPYYMYPFIHLMRDGNLFVFVSKSSQVFNVDTNSVIRTFADLPGDYRTYPNTGGSVLLPLSSATNWDPDIIICGGGAYQDITSPTDPSCGRIKPLAASPQWEMDSMPEGRGMVEGTLLPDGTVIWLNGANHGAQGFGLGADPTLEALIYDPTKPKGQRWTTGSTSTIPRLYHSVATLLLDGTIMIAGSNPVEMPVLNADAKNPYPTEFRVEIYTPPYLSGANAKKRPTAVKLSARKLKANGSKFTINFTAPANAQAVKVALYYGGFVTHSVHMGHRMAFLDTTGFKASATAQTITVTMPPNSNVAPPGPYVVYVVVDGVPAVGQFVLVS